MFIICHIKGIDYIASGVGHPLYMDKAMAFVQDWIMLEFLWNSNSILKWWRNIN